MTRKNTIAKIGKAVVSFDGEGDEHCVAASSGSHRSAGKGPSARGPPPDSLLTVEETAGFLRCSISALNKWRVSGNGPRFVRVGARVRYRTSDLLNFIENRTRVSTSEAPAA